MRKLLLLFLLMVSSSVLAADWKPLVGLYAITPEAYLGPPRHEPKESHFSVHLTGDAARDLYHAIHAEDRIEECSRATSKNVSNIRCLYFKKDDQYECRFSINLHDNSLIDESVTC